ncbi:uncharacterized protein RCC_06539 [Ramularia collo-cygni]|uniref:Uncharacterized protein n=1 Tax=Ramularia collo-cygni TaxID=112498 RepID=A0A2D3UVG8_9PEZI|nr:uncharacterized protein RCC_06539 [Ramularia collo-cygni]CZT20681.1 uncharacterized protein RCC_06539 [Ramularia collo-cygni]
MDRLASSRTITSSRTNKKPDTQAFPQPTSNMHAIHLTLAALALSFPAWALPSAPGNATLEARADRWEIEFFSSLGCNGNPNGQAGSTRRQGCQRVGGGGAEGYSWHADGFKAKLYAKDDCSGDDHDVKETNCDNAGFKIQSYEVKKKLL